MSGWNGLVDPLTAYLCHPDDEQRIAHRPETEDACTVVTLGDALVAGVMGEWPTVRPFWTTGVVDLAHRMLLARSRRGADEFELAERVVRLAEDAFLLADDAGRGDRGPSFHRSSPSRRRLVESARELLATDPAGVTFDGLADELGVSRSHLSRTFRADTGETLTAFRARLRVRAALDRLDGGETSLARLAAELGFADHAHLTRTVHTQLGSPPSRVRALLGGEPR